MLTAESGSPLDFQFISFCSSSSFILFPSQSIVRLSHIFALARHRCTVRCPVPLFSLGRESFQFCNMCTTQVLVVVVCSFLFRFRLPTYACGSFIEFAYLYALTQTHSHFDYNIFFYLTLNGTEKERVLVYKLWSNRWDRNYSISISLVGFLFSSWLIISIFAYNFGFFVVHLCAIWNRNCENKIKKCEKKKNNRIQRDYTNVHHLVVFC